MQSWLSSWGVRSRALPLGVPVFGAAWLVFAIEPMLPTLGMRRPLPISM